MEKLETMIEKTGKCVEINGGFVVIDHTDKEEDGKGIATVINVYSKDEEIHEHEIYTAVKLFASGGVGHLKAGETDFSFIDIWTSNPSNDEPLKNHKEPTKIVVIKNKETKEFFLIASNNVSFRDVRDFIYEINRSEGRKLLRDGSYFLELQQPRPHGVGELMTDGPPTFEVVTKSDLVIIKLETR